MVAVLVRHESGLNARRVESGLVAAGKEVAFADAAVNEHARACDNVFHHGGVSRASAGQYVQCKHANPSVRRRFRRKCNSAPV